MTTLTLRVSDSVYEKLVWLLSKFGKDELEIIERDEKFLKDKLYLENELNEILSSETQMLSFDEVSELLDRKIEERGNSI